MDTAAEECQRRLRHKADLNAFVPTQASAWRRCGGVCWNSICQFSSRENVPADGYDIEMLRGILNATTWLLGKVWTWPVVGMGATALYGAGLTALFGDEYVAASVLCVLAILWLTLKAIFWEETTDHEHPGLVRCGIVVLGLVVAAPTLMWVRYQSEHNADHPALSPRAPPSTGPASVPAPSSTKEPPPPVSARQPRSTLHRKLDLTVPVKTAAAPIVLSARIYDPQSPSIVVSNKSNRVAENVTWELLVFRTSDLSYFSFRTQTIGYVKPDSVSSPYSMNLEGIIGEVDGDGSMKPGDHFVGSLIIDCPECQGATYLVSLDWKQGGWIWEAPTYQGKLLVPKDMSREGRAKFTSMIESLAPDAEREPIVPRE